MEDEFINQFDQHLSIFFSGLGKNKQLENMLDPKFHAQKLFDNLRAPISCVAPQQHEGIWESDIVS